MSDLFITYREETKKELLNLYAKSCILKEYIHILPILSKISIDNTFLDTISKKIINDYYSKVGVYIGLVEFTEIVKNSIQTIFNKASEIHNEVLLFKDDLINNIKIYNTESSSVIKSLNEEKYSNNNIYIEKYFYLSEQNFNLINGLSFAVLLSKNYIGVVSLNDMLSLLNNAINLNPNLANNIFNILPKFEYGVRLMYNPVVNFQNKKQKYDIISSKEIPSKEKINAIFYDNGRNSEYYFPIKLSELRYNLYSILGEKNIENLYQLVNNFDGIFNLVAKSLWTEENFKNLFMYHIPLQIVYPIMFKNISDKYKLLKQVFDKNLPYTNLNETIINLIDRIENAEDPNTL